MRRWRFLLPALLGVASAVLMSWQAYNSRIMVSMGMAWDTGAPGWPYQTPEIVLVALNAPAYFITAPLFSVFGLPTAEERTPILLLATLLLWFFVGRSLEVGIVPRAWLHHRKWLFCTLGPLALLCVYVSIRLAAAGAGWWAAYGELSLPTVLILARTVGPLPWCVLASSVLVWVLIQSVRPSV